MISIIIPSYNSEDTIYRCLKALFNQSYTGDYEVILADSSQDHTRQIVREKFPGVRLIQFKAKTDPGTARNAAILQSKGDPILFIDSDCIAEPDWIERMLARHQNSAYAAVGGSILNGNDSGNVVARAGYLAEFREFLPGGTIRPVTHIPTCNISYKRFVFKEIGEFDASYYPQEDLVFNYRLCAAGHSILFDPDIKIRHIHRTLLSDFLRHQFKIGKITARVLRHYPLSGHRIVNNRLLLLLGILLVPFIKWVRTVNTFMKRDPYILIRQPLAWIVFAIGLVPWTAGFLKQGLTGENHR